MNSDLSSLAVCFLLGSFELQYSFDSPGSHRLKYKMWYLFISTVTIYLSICMYTAYAFMSIYILAGTLWNNKFRIFDIQVVFLLAMNPITITIQISLMR